ncbi:hypothetical protein Cni_G17914 [Canna indica]|uniref:Uncharacterized protein n=1 Tax=Canna indica TaxID=4628 RepID=A0AAQ3KNI6_9LILI|nr:hypothetical protein Cni_G17914 [Canna indica]
MEEHLIDPRPSSTDATTKSAGCQTRVFKLLFFIACLFLAANAASSIYRSRDNPSALAFIAFVYLDLVALFVGLKKYEKLERDAPAERRQWLKAAVWALATALNLAFAWRVAEVMPPMLSVVVWAMAGSVAVGGFFGLFIYRDADDKASGHVYATVVDSEQGALP